MWYVCTHVVIVLLCYFCILLVYHCALYLWNINYTTCTQTLSLPLLPPSRVTTVPLSENTGVQAGDSTQATVCMELRWRVPFPHLNSTYLQSSCSMRHGYLKEYICESVHIHTRVYTGLHHDCALSQDDKDDNSPWWWRYECSCLLGHHCSLRVLLAV